MWEQFIDDWKSTRKKSEWICESCIYYPPSSCDGKPCCLCDPDDPMLNCYQEKEGADNDTRHLEDAVLHFAWYCFGEFV